MFNLPTHKIPREKKPNTTYTRKKTTSIPLFITFTPLFCFSWVHLVFPPFLTPSTHHHSPTIKEEGSSPIWDGQEFKTPRKKNSSTPFFLSSTPTHLALFSLKHTKSIFHLHPNSRTQGYYYYFSTFTYNTYILNFLQDQHKKKTTPFSSHFLTSNSLSSWSTKKREKNYSLLPNRKEFVFLFDISFFSYQDCLDLPQAREKSSRSTPQKSEGLSEQRPLL